MSSNFELESELIDKGFINVVGLDEAGRGPLAASVFAGAVILDTELVNVFEGNIKDSKKLSKNKRKEYADLIKASCIWAIGEATVDEIDALNILNATKLAMKRALKQLPHADYALVDGNMDMSNIFNIPYRSIIKGDNLCLSVSAASILAKEAQVAKMLEIDVEFPEYGFKSHKGYGTAEHCEAIVKYGPCKYHRKTFSRVREFVAY